MAEVRALARGSIVQNPSPSPLPGIFRRLTPSIMPPDHFESEEISGVREISAQKAERRLLTSDEMPYLFRLLSRTKKTIAKLETLREGLPEGKRREQLDTVIPQLELTRTLFVNLLAEGNQGLVWDEAIKVYRELKKDARNRSMHLTVEDLVQYGQFPLYRAIDRYDYTKGYVFCTYAIPSIRRGIMKEVLEAEPLIYFPKHVLDSIKVAARFIYEYRQEHGTRPSVAEVCETVTRIKTEIFVKNYVERHGKEPSEQEISQNVVPFSYQTLRSAAAVGMRIYGKENDEGEFQDPVSALPDQNALSVVKQMAFIELKHLVGKLVGGLSEIEQRIITARFGLDGEEEKTQEEIAAELGVHKNRISQLETAALCKLNLLAREHCIEDYY